MTAKVTDRTGDNAPGRNHHHHFIDTVFPVEDPPLDHRRNPRRLRVGLTGFNTRFA